ncbi:helix-turn-helix domain-containing protein [Faecalicatena contorta]|uniref:helix-turn-helix domain-containing protein n=1 Tax=Faecalicatena contorta TaxID=39482 RepID=UPI001F399D3E|nr:helix-turn-helix transcriptional regulator [Faecalicatena contorta]MCF2684380.1 helix-turn-helix transcriptional regulator [Faecalicatena contorta]
MFIIEGMDKVRDVSLTLGQSESYINRIESHKMLPSMTVFFYICDYFEITPEEFFSNDKELDIELIGAINKLKTLDPDKKSHILAVINDL